MDRDVLKDKTKQSKHATGARRVQIKSKFIIEIKSTSSM